MSAGQKILVIGELDQKGGYTSLTGELLGGARKLADELDGRVDVLLLSSGNLEWENICRGADRVSGRAQGACQYVA